MKKKPAASAQSVSSKSKSTQPNSFDVVVAGGGPSGLTMATRIAALGLRIAVIEREKAEAMTQVAFDGRTTAFAYGSVMVLEACGVWQKMAAAACPIDDIRVADQHSPIILDFESRRSSDHPFGYILENSLFRNVLFERMAECANITLLDGTQIERIDTKESETHITLNHGQVITAKLLIAADGKKSTCREQAGIQARHWSYNETALVVNVQHSNSHDNLALELFYPGGPFAVLPMSKNRSSIVWTERPDTAHALHTMHEDGFIELLKQRGCAYLGQITLASPRQLYPLRFMLADKLHAPRMALIGEAAHGMHPVAGQGFNLSVRDIEVLTQLIEQQHAAGGDIGALDLLQCYESKRHLDHFVFMAATDALVKLFSNNFLPLRIARRFGLGVVSKLAPAKKFFTKMAMGMLTG